MIKNVIFDWSGVVKDCVKENLVITNKIFKHFGVKEILMAEFKKEWCQPYMSFYKKYIPNITMQEQSIVYKKSISESPKAKSYPGITELIKKVKKSGKKVFVVSSDDLETILPEIKSFGLEGIFDGVVFGVHDKEQEVYQIVKANSLNKNDTIFIGDSNHEVEVGKKLGIRTIAVTWGFSLENKLKSYNPDFLVHNLEELENAIL